MESIKLTHLSKGSGCGCKLPSKVLSEILEGNTALHAEFTKLIVGNQESDDAAVYELGNGMALVSTVDFFSPIVDDPFLYGRIAAANAISDVYAMGGTPVLATAILAWPSEKLPASVASLVLKGAQDCCKEAGIPLAGGHSVESTEPFFGLSVNGLVPLANIKQNKNAKEGDLILITKPIGSGAITTAVKREIIQASDEIYIKAVEHMRTLNSSGVKLAELAEVHAMTDITGFGLLGHLIEVCKASGVQADVFFPSVPLMDGMKDLCKRFIYADNTMRNWKAYESVTGGIQSESLLSLCDPQTNGGLMLFVDPSKLDAVEKFLQSIEQPVYKIGRITTTNSDKIIRVIDSEFQ